MYLIYFSSYLFAEISDALSFVRIVYDINQVPTFSLSYWQFILFAYIYTPAATTYSILQGENFIYTFFKNPNRFIDRFDVTLNYKRLYECSRERIVYRRYVHPYTTPNNKIQQYMNLLSNKKQNKKNQCIVSKPNNITI